MSGKTPDWMPELFFCHRYEFCLVADQLGFRCGTRADEFETNRIQQLLDDDIALDLVDNNFKDPDTQRLSSIVKKTGAEFVVLPDVYAVCELDQIIEYGKQLVSDFDVTPIIVPKCSIDESTIPPSWIIGFSVPSGYGETDIPVTEWTDHRVHLLGGSPRNQIQYANVAVDAGVDVFSVDGNSFAKAASYGNIINEPVEILDSDGAVDGNAWAADVDGYTDWGQRIAKSLGRYYELWRQWSMIQSEQFTAAMIKSNR
jgi:hypothetical protein